MNIQKFTKCNAKSLLFLIFFIVLFWGINQCLPFVMDDPLYAHIYPKVSHFIENPHGLDVDETINSFSDIIESQYHHYFRNNGRYLVHFMAQIFCGLLGKNCYNIFAAVLFGLFVVFLWKVCNNKRVDCITLSIPVLCVFVFSPEPTCYYGGITQGVNYLWPATICMLFALCFMNAKSSKVWITLLLAILSFVSGWSHEGVAIGMAGGLIGYSIFNYKKMQTVQWGMLLCFIIGVALLVFAPGNFARVERLNTGENDIDISSVLLARFRLFFFVRAFYLLLIVIIFWFCRNRRTLFTFLKDNVLWVSSVLMSFLFLIFVGVLNKRALVGIEFYSSILLCKMLFESSFFMARQRIYSIFAMSVIVVCGVVVLYYQVQAGNQYKSMDYQVKNSQYSSCFVKVPEVNPNYFIKRFVFQYKFDEPWEYWERYVLAWKFKKQQVVIAEGDWHDVAGNNSFKQLGNYLFSTEDLPANISLVLHLGEYQAFDLASFLKKMVSYVYSSKAYELKISLPVEKVFIENKYYNVVELYPTSSRKIVAIDVEY